MFLRQERPLIGVELEELYQRYKHGLGNMLDIIIDVSPDVVFYPGDSAVKMAGDLESLASSLGLQLPSGIKVRHDLNRYLYVQNPHDTVGRLLTLVKPHQRVLFTDDTAEFGDKLSYYNQLFQFAGFVDFKMIILVAGNKYKYRGRTDVPFQVLLYDQDLFDYLANHADS